MKLKQITACLVAATFFGSNPAFAQTSKVSGDVIKIGVLTDLSSTYSDLAGPGAVIAAKMDFLNTLVPSFNKQYPLKERSPVISDRAFHLRGD